MGANFGEFIEMDRTKNRRYEERSNPRATCRLVTRRLENPSLSLGRQKAAM